MWNRWVKVACISLWVVVTACRFELPDAPPVDAPSDAALATLAQRAYIKASNTGVDDMFGIVVALSSDNSTLAVGAYREDSATIGVGGNQSDNSVTDAGAVYIFTRSGMTWRQEAYLKATNTGANDWFGGSLSLSSDGSTLAVSAVTEDSAATGIDGSQVDNSAVDAGAVYVFVRSGASWDQQAYIKSSNTNENDRFGKVLLSGDGGTLAVGAYAEDSAAAGVGGDQLDNSAVDAGAVYVFTRTGTTWTQQAYLKASNPGASDFFGASLALSVDGSTLAAGAIWEDSAANGIGGSQADNSTMDAGAVYVFKRSGALWSQQAYIKASNPDPNDQFGASVALSGDGSTLAVGAYYEGSAGRGVDMGQLDNSAAQAGAVYIFVRSGTSWAQQSYLKASNTDGGDWFGYCVALSEDGSKLAVGSLAEDSAARGTDGLQSDNSATSAGAVYVFTRSATGWRQRAYVKPSNAEAGDMFATDVSLSGDGSTLVVGAYGEDSAAIDINGSETNNTSSSAGAVYEFR